MEELKRALFLDRDGVVNREIGYLWKPEQTEFTAGIFELCRIAQGLEYKVIILTNQSGIARQLYSESDFHALMQWMACEFASREVQLDGYYYCPHHPEHGIGRYRLDCPDRKPKPGMILRAAHDHGIDLGQSILVGDRCSDIQAGAAAAIGKLMLLEGIESDPCPLIHSYASISSLWDVMPFLVPAAIGTRSREERLSGQN